MQLMKESWEETGNKGLVINQDRQYRQNMLDCLNIGWQVAQENLEGAQKQQKEVYDQRAKEWEF